MLQTAVNAQMRIRGCINGSTCRYMKKHTLPMCSEYAAVFTKGYPIRHSKIKRPNSNGHRPFASMLANGNADRLFFIRKRVSCSATIQFYDPDALSNAVIKPYTFRFCLSAVITCI